MVGELELGQEEDAPMSMAGNPEVCATLQPVNRDQLNSSSTEQGVCLWHQQHTIKDGEGRE
jgi:hypothetical protein